MRTEPWMYWKRALTIALIAGPMLALVSIDVEAGRRGGGGFGGGGGPGVRAPRANIGGGPVHGPNNNFNRRDVNVNRNVNVDVDRHWGYGAVGAGAAVAVGTAVAVGAIVSTLPPSCSAFVANGVTYQNCGGTYYVPRYDGPNVVYEVVPAPPGWNQ
ncbi:MAG TPA: hypothetical protein PKI41_09355 [Candidatus Competibacteraceae bacterium]|nr:MAG: hypothetical protein EKK71_03420 [Candidatus Competibacteraceae bacterium]HOB62317.1 hypothetical protein [Candidatus Competibacteraceae bacterium]HQA26237.1 hypothetical protein [Candidatus Competibacteraceae bacterium]HQD56781.1 hypothetical protein [Candidatus Competibacteraceae bacterium]